MYENKLMRVTALLLFAFTCLAVAGCGSDGYIEVTGTITLDGDPLPDAFVMFYPKDIENGSTYSGKTDDSGNVVMEMTASQSGVQPGEYVVTVFTEDEAEAPEGSEEDFIMIDELVPRKYTGVEIGEDGIPVSELEFTVSAENTTFKFDLTTE